MRQDISESLARVEAQQEKWWKRLRTAMRMVDDLDKQQRRLTNRLAKETESRKLARLAKRAMKQVTENPPATVDVEAFMAGTNSP